MKEESAARSTLTSTVARTAAATAARRSQAARRAAVRLGVEQLDHLDDEHLVALTVALLGEVKRRGIVELRVR